MPSSPMGPKIPAEERDPNIVSTNSNNPSIVSGCVGGQDLSSGVRGNDTLGIFRAFITRETIRSLPEVLLSYDCCSHDDESYVMHVVVITSNEALWKTPQFLDDGRPCRVIKNWVHPIDKDDNLSALVVDKITEFLCPPTEVMAIVESYRYIAQNQTNVVSMHPLYYGGKWCIVFGVIGKGYIPTNNSKLPPMLGELPVIVTEARIALAEGTAAKSGNGLSTHEKVSPGCAISVYPKFCAANEDGTFATVSCILKHNGHYYFATSGHLFRKGGIGTDMFDAGTTVTQSCGLALLINGAYPFQSKPFDDYDKLKVRHNKEKQLEKALMQYKDNASVASLDDYKKVGTLTKTYFGNVGNNKSGEEDPMTTYDVAWVELNNGIVAERGVFTDRQDYMDESKIEKPFDGVELFYSMDEEDGGDPSTAAWTKDEFIKTLKTLLCNKMECYVYGARSGPVVGKVLSMCGTFVYTEYKAKDGNIDSYSTFENEVPKQTTGPTPVPAADALLLNKQQYTDYILTSLKIGQGDSGAMVFTLDADRTPRMLGIVTYAYSDKFTKHAALIMPVWNLIAAFRADFTIPAGID